MSTIDLFEDGFPHSTREGYDRGCRGSACPGKLDNGFSCSEAAVRWAGDFRYQTRVLKGMTPAEIRDLDPADVAAAAAEATAVKPKKRARVVAPKIVPVDVTPVAVPAVVAADPVPAPSPAPERVVRVAAEIEHGTSAGYKRGCRTDEGCPGDADGVSCRSANASYQRDYRERRQQNGGQRLGSRMGMQRAERILVAVPVVEDVLAPSVEELQARVAELEQQLVAARAAAWSTLIEKAGVDGATVLRLEVLGGSA